MIELREQHSSGPVRAVLIAVVGGLFVLAVFLGFKSAAQASELSQLQQQIVTQRTNNQVVIFLQLFIEKVLKTDTAVSFEDRLRLENAVRDINDPVILQKWENFINASTEIQIQVAVKDLLESLVSKITY